MSDAHAYDRHKEQAAKRQREQSAAGREIGPLPEVVNPERRESCRTDFCLFAKTYFPAIYSLEFSPDHLQVIAQIQRAVAEGGLFALAMPRGSGKTSLCETACLWASLYGYREFVVLIGADLDSANQSLLNIKSELEANELLLGDFPEVCYPVRCLDRVVQRGRGQTLDGKPTNLSWSSDEAILPTVPGSSASGAVIRTAGITGRIRGMSHTRADGRKVRPSLAIIDDPQTDETANSPAQCAARERVISGAILGLAGPGVKMSAIMPCTVIREGDLTDRMLDRQTHPDWAGTRTKMLYSMPSSMALWDKYAEIRAASLRADGDGHEATEFYAANRETMDAGCTPAWTARHNADEISAIQHAMNIYIRDPLTFAAEFQNDPVIASEASAIMTAGEISAKLHGLPRGQASALAIRCTAFIDVQERGLFWALLAWQAGFTGQVIDYGAFPRQPRSYFTYRDMGPNLETELPTHGVEARITEGLKRLIQELASYTITLDGGSTLQVERIGVDIGDHGEVVEQALASSPWRARLQPMRGYGITTAAVPMADWAKRPGERRHAHWIEQASGPGKPLRRIISDVNHWKSFVHSRLKTPIGGQGSLSLFGQSPEAHRCLADHLTSERPIEQTGRGRTLHVWRIIPGRDNHWLDCVVGATVMASVLGERLEEEARTSDPERRKASPKDYARKRDEFERKRGGHAR